LISTNIDGLHLSAGFPREKIAELHGNAFMEICTQCKTTFTRDHDVLGGVSSIGKTHITGNSCESCGGALRDNIVNFGEFIDQEAMELAGKMSWDAHIAFVLGTSLRVAPANKFPTYSYLRNNGKMIIVNLQKTPLDYHAFLKIYAATDDVMVLLASELGMEIQGLTPDGKDFLGIEELETKYRIKHEDMKKLGRNIPEKTNMVKDIVGGHASLLAGVLAFDKNILNKAPTEKSKEDQ